MSPEEAAAKAREILDARVEHVRHLTDSARSLEKAREAFESATKEYSQAWSEAEKAGWTVSELRQLGLTEPGKRRPGRPRKKNVSGEGAVSAPAAPGTAAT